MLLQESRRTARTSSTGDLILLEDQNRSLWNLEQISEGRVLVQRRSRHDSVRTHFRLRSRQCIPGTDRRGQRTGEDCRFVRYPGRAVAHR